MERSNEPLQDVQRFPGPDHGARLRELYKQIEVEEKAIFDRISDLEQRVRILEMKVNQQQENA